MPSEARLYKCVRVRVHVCMCVLSLHSIARTYIRQNALTITHTHTYTHAHVHMRIHTHTHVRLHVHSHTRTRAHPQRTNARTYTHTHAHTPTEIFHHSRKHACSVQIRAAFAISEYRHGSLRRAQTPLRKSPALSHLYSNLIVLHAYHLPSCPLHAEIDVSIDLFDKIICACLHRNCENKQISHTFRLSCSLFLSFSLTLAHTFSVPRCGRYVDVKLLTFSRARLEGCALRVTTGNGIWQRSAHTCVYITFKHIFTNVYMCTQKHTYMYTSIQTHVRPLSMRTAAIYVYTFIYTYIYIYIYIFILICIDRSYAYINSHTNKTFVLEKGTARRVASSESILERSSTPAVCTIDICLWRVC